MRAGSGIILGAPGGAQEGAVGSVFKRTSRGKKSRTYYGKVQDPLTGRWALVNTGCTDKAVASRRLRELQSEREAVATGQAPERRPLAEHLADYAEHQRQQGLSEAHVRQTGSELVKVAAYCAGLPVPRRVDRSKLEDHRTALGRADLSCVTQDRVDAFVSSLPVHVTARTRNAFRSSVVAFFDFLKRKRRVAPAALYAMRDVTVSQGPRKHRRRALTAAEVSALIAAARTRDPSGERALVYLTAFYTGLRRGEIEALRVAHLDLGERPSLSLPGEFTKNGQEALLPIPPALAGPLAAWVRGRSPLAVVFALGAAGSLLSELKRDLAHAGVPYRDARGLYADFHALRKSLATHLRLAGVDPAVSQKYMRHADIRLTMETYTDSGMLDLHAACARLPDVS
jgi:integrase